MMRQPGARGLMLAGLATVLGMATVAEARQATAGRPAVEVGVRSVAFGNDRAGGPGAGAQVTWNLDGRTAVEVSADYRPSARASSITLGPQQVYVHLKHAFYASGAGGFFGMVGGAAGFAPHRRPIGGISTGVGCDWFVAPRLAIEVQTQIVITRDQPRFRALVGVSVPLGRFPPKPERAAPASATFSAVKAGHTAWVTMADGRVLKGVAAGVSTTTIDLVQGRATTSLPLGDIRRVEVPDSITDGAKGGAYIGLLMAVPAAMFRRLTPGRFNGEEFPPLVYSVRLAAWGCIGAGMGAVIGAIADSLIEERRVVYDSGRSSLTVAPIVSRRGAGIGGVIRW